jgi:hypothetical protein
MLMFVAALAFLFAVYAQTGMVLRGTFPAEFVFR